MLEEKIKIFIKNGFIYDKETGNIYNRNNKIISCKANGYIRLRIMVNYKKIRVYGHQFAWYYINLKIANMIDHIDGDKLNNRIDNLRSVNAQQNNFNRKCKGYYFYKRDKVWVSQITIDQKNKYLGRYDTENEARQAYLEAKKIYHII